MEAAIIASVMIAVFLPLLFMATRDQAAKEKARRMAEHRMNARLLKFNI